MTHNEEILAIKTKFTIASVALLFCLVWAIIGESDMKIIAVTLAFTCFLRQGIDLEMHSHASGDH